MKHRVSTLSGWNLNAAVALAEGHTIQVLQRVGTSPCFGWLNASGAQMPCPNYCSAWSAGGPIKERERIASEHIRGEPAEACIPTSDYDLFVPNRAHYMTGPTQLVAAMRTRVHSVFGGEVEIPELEQDARSPQ